MTESQSVFCWPVRVYYEDTDAGGIVYYANYLKFMERARSEWLRSRGADPAILSCDSGEMFVVRSVKLDFLQPAHLSDTLDVSVRVIHRRPASVMLHQDVTRAGKMLCSGEVRLACIDIHTLRPRPLPGFFANENNH